MNARCGAVSARQQRVTPEYIGKARRADRTYNGIRRNDVGPLEAEVKRQGRIDGLVFGAYGEASSYVEQLVKKLRQVVGLRQFILTMRKDVGVRLVPHGGRGDKRIIGPYCRVNRG